MSSFTERGALFPKKKGHVEITKLRAWASTLMTEWSTEEDETVQYCIFHWWMHRIWYGWINVTKYARGQTIKWLHSSRIIFLSCLDHARMPRWYSSILIVLFNIPMHKWVKWLVVLLVIVQFQEILRASSIARSKCTAQWSFVTGLSKYASNPVFSGIRKSEITGQLTSVSSDPVCIF
jgi:hypothetical protein